MLDEGAGKRGAIDLSRALDDLGARLVDRRERGRELGLADGAEAAPRARRSRIFGDVVARPRFEATELKRVKDLWANELLERAKDPDATARVVYRVALFGADHPYGHPWDGTPKSAQRRDARRRASASTRRRGAPTGPRSCAPATSRRPQLDVAARRGLRLVEGARRRRRRRRSSRRRRRDPGRGSSSSTAPTLRSRSSRRVRPGLEASSPEMPALVARERRHRRELHLAPQPGPARAARLHVRRRIALLASRAARGSSWHGPTSSPTRRATRSPRCSRDLQKFAAGGLTDEEVARTRSQARAELVGVVRVGRGHRRAPRGRRGARPAAPTTRRRRARRGTRRSSAAARRAREAYYSPDDAILVVVGPRARIQPMIDKLGLPAPEIRDADGNVVGR